MFDLETRETTIVISGEDYKKLCKLGRESRMKRNGDLAIKKAEEEHIMLVDCLENRLDKDIEDILPRLEVIEE